MWHSMIYQSGITRNFNSLIFYDLKKMNFWNSDKYLIFVNLQAKV